MPNWKTYKGEGPWDFTKSQAENKYNISRDIVNGGQPVWDLNATTVGLNGTPITPIHHPNCGMWNGLEAPGPPAFPPLTPVVDPVSLLLTHVSWTPNYGGAAFGRFVGIRGGAIYHPAVVYYSDDGGYNWTNIGSCALNDAAAKYVNLITYIREKGYFIAAGFTDPYTAWTAISYDGISWTMGTPFNTGGYASPFYNIVWNPSVGVFAAASAAGGALSWCWTSTDGLAWTARAHLQLYGVYHGGVIFNDLYYLYAYNYAYYKKTSLIAPVTIVDLVGAEIPTPAGADGQRGEAATDGNVIVYDYCYYDGATWIVNNNPVNHIDYNPLSDEASGAGLFASTTRRIFPVDQFKTVGLSRDGITWVYTNTGIDYGLYDVAVGWERVVCASATNIIYIIIAS